MGLRSWLFPTPAEKLEKARAKLARGHFAEARLDALALGDLPGVDDVVDLAEEGLARLNLEAAVAAAASGDAERTAFHLDLAGQFAGPGLEDAFADARARIGVHQETHAAERRRRDVDEAARLLDVDPRFKADHAAAEVPLPPGVSEEEAEAVKVRLGLILETWPEPLRGQMITLGAPFAQAILDLEDGRPDSARALLATLPDDSALVQHERARAAEATGDLPAAVVAWEAFATLAGGHAAIGEHHTGVLLARDRAIVGDRAGAVELLGELRKADPDLATGLWAELLELVGRLDEAEAALRGLLRAHGPHPRLVHGLARVKVAGGDPRAAIQILEQGVAAGPPGAPPDLGLNRLLATLVLESGDRSERALALAELARGLVEQPEWDDVYLAALAAKARDDEKWTDLRDRLHAVTPDDDPRRHRLTTWLG